MTTIPKEVDQLMIAFKFCLALRVLEALPIQTKTTCANILELKLQIKICAEELGGNYDALIAVFTKHVDSVSEDAEQFYAMAGKAEAAMQSAGFVAPTSNSVH